MATDKKNEKILHYHFDNTARNVWVDNLHIAMRQDDVGIIRLSTNLPEGLYEQVRFMTSKKQLKEFVDIICATINYYPSNDKVENLTMPPLTSGKAKALKRSKK